MKYLKANKVFGIWLSSRVPLLRDKI